MPRDPISINKLKNGVGDGQTDVSFTTGVPANNHYWVYQEGDILLVNNTGVVGRVVDVYGPANQLGRAVDADGKTSVSVTPGASSFFDLRSLGWTQTGADSGRVHVDVENANLRLAVLRR